ncbi:hypothetical protein PI125_g25980 [Phytophthora idaei]|nr:hypothetical protein PI125_g25980 [Phytophthora idaei]
MEESDEIVTPLIRHRIKVLRCSLSVINDGAAHVSGIGFGGEVAPNLEAISDALGIHGARSVATERGEEGVTGVGAFSSSSLGERFELEALGSSSRGRRDPVTGSCATSADSESAAEDGTSPSSMGTSLMSDP